MKKLLLGLFTLGLIGCGGHTCDAYRSSDLTKGKPKNQIKFVQKLIETK